MLKSLCYWVSSVLNAKSLWSYVTSKARVHPNVTKWRQMHVEKTAPILIKIAKTHGLHLSLWASVSMLNMTVYDSVLRKKLNKYGLF